MPHGHGGGGSHGGGSHSRSRHGGGSSVHVSAPRISRSYFNGARRYMYRGFGGREYFVYCDKEPKPTTVGELIFSLMFSLFFVGMGVVIFVLAISLVSPPQKLNARCSGYHIVDNIGVIDNQPRLEQALQAFEDKTGICPCVVTVYDGFWDTSCSDIEDAAYYEYVTRWRDEKHFLIFYSASEMSPSTVWEWHDMSGDDTDRIITDGHFAVFQKDLNNSLRSRSTSVGESLEAAFRNSLDYMMDATVDADGVIFILMGVFWEVISVTTMVMFIRSFIISRRKYTEVSEYYKPPVFQDYSKGYNPSDTHFE
ncbi:MAG: hypothetical protein J1F04_04620 [Oscillospiraceae bacterium]|nr:hypothetical protein [Oscillospiraceae bacterium]